MKRDKLFSWAGIASAILLAGCCCWGEENKTAECTKAPASEPETMCCCCFLGPRKLTCPMLKAHCKGKMKTHGSCAKKKTSRKCMQRLQKGGEALSSLCKGDPKAFSAHLPEAKRVQGEVKAAETVKKLGADQGKVQSAEFVTNLNQPQQEVTVWKLGLLTTGPDGETATDTLFQITFAPDSDEILDFGIL